MYRLGVVLFGAALLCPLAAPGQTPQPETESILADLLVRIVAATVPHPDNVTVSGELRSVRTPQGLECPQFAARLFVHRADQRIVAPARYVRSVVTVFQPFLERELGLAWKNRSACRSVPPLRLTIMDGYDEAAPSVPVPLKVPSAWLEAYLTFLIEPGLSRPDVLSVEARFSCDQNEKEFGCREVAARVRVDEADLPAVTDPKYQDSLRLLFYHATFQAGRRLIGNRSIYSYPVIRLEIRS